MFFSPSLPSIWIIDSASNHELYTQILSIQFELRYFDDLNELTRESDQPSLILAEAPLTRPREALKKLLSIKAPIALVSRNDSIDFMRECLRSGADAYLLKPLRQSELILTLERLLGVELLPNTLDAKPVAGLTLKERQLLAIFLTRESAPRADLCGALWNGVNVNRKTLDVHLFNLRRKLHPLGFDIACVKNSYRLVRRSVYSERLSSA